MKIKLAILLITIFANSAPNAMATLAIWTPLKGISAEDAKSSIQTLLHAFDAELLSLGQFAERHPTISQWKKSEDPTVQLFRRLYQQGIFGSDTFFARRSAEIPYVDHFDPESSTKMIVEDWNEVYSRVLREIIRAETDRQPEISGFIDYDSLAGLLDARSMRSAIDALTRMGLFGMHLNPRQRHTLGRLLYERLYGEMDHLRLNALASGAVKEPVDELLLMSPQSERGPYWVDQISKVLDGGSADETLVIPGRSRPVLEL